MSGDKKWTRRAAIGFIGVGAGLFVTETAGFTRIDGVRDVNLDTEEDPNAFVGFSPLDDDGAVSGLPGDDVELFELTNNFENETDTGGMSVDVQIKSTGSGIGSADITTIDSPSSIPKGESKIVSAELSSNGGAAGEVEFRIHVTQGGISTTLDRTILIEIETQTQAAVLDKGEIKNSSFATTTGSTGGGGNSGVGFQLATGSSESRTVTVTAIGVPRATSSGKSPVKIRAAEEEDGEFVEVSSDGNNSSVEQVFVDRSGQSPSNIQIGSNANVVSLNQNNLKIDPNDPNDAPTVVLRRFRRQDGNRVNMQSEEVDVLLVFNDGSELEIKLET